MWTHLKGKVLNASRTISEFQHYSWCVCRGSDASCALRAGPESALKEGGGGNTPQQQRLLGKQRLNVGDGKPPLGGTQGIRAEQNLSEQWKP